LSLICRHNRFMADCPICSKGTPLEHPSGHRQRAAAPRRSAGSRSTRSRPAAAPAVKGPYGSAGPYTDDDGSYEVRLERVPGGLRLAAWAAGALRRRAPVLAEDDLAGLVRGAIEQGAVSESDGLPAEPPAGDGRSPGRSGDMRDELRVERLDDGLLRIARWVMRPGRGWELQDAPVMLPAARFAEALVSGVAAGSRPT
jgi:hypothetical protein